MIAKFFRMIACVAAALAIGFVIVIGGTEIAVLAIAALILLNVRHA